MVTMAQSTVNWRNTHTHMDRSHSLTHLKGTVTTTLCEAPAQLLVLQTLESILKVPEGGGANRRTQRNPVPSNSLPANRFHILLLEEKIQRPGRDSNPRPPTLMISSPTQEIF